VLSVHLADEGADNATDFLNRSRTGNILRPLFNYYTIIIKYN